GAAACDYDLSYYVDGGELDQRQTAVQAAQMTRRNDDTMGETGRGVLTEVYVDINEEETTIVEIHTYLAIAQSDYNSRTEDIDLDVYYDVHNGAAESAPVD